MNVKFFTVVENECGRNLQVEIKLDNGVRPMLLQDVKSAIQIVSRYTS